VLGACTSARTAAAFCGPAAVAAATGGCAPRAPCEPGQALDLGSGACLPRREVRAIAVGLGILVGDDELVGCPREGGVLAADGDSASGPSRLGCLPRLPAAPTPTCAAGQIAAPNGACAQVQGRSTVDVARWAQAALGSDGARPSPLCEALARSGLEPPAASATSSLVSLVFPDNDVSLVTFRAAAELERALAPLIEALRSFGGTASQASVTVRVDCAAAAGALGHPGERPAALTPENDHGK
jgi:hypothetical protein